MKCRECYSRGWPETYTRIFKIKRLSPSLDAESNSTFRCLDAFGKLSACTGVLSLLSASPTGNPTAWTNHFMGCISWSFCLALIVGAMGIPEKSGFDMLMIGNWCSWCTDVSWFLRFLKLLQFRSTWTLYLHPLSRVSQKANSKEEVLLSLDALTWSYQGRRRWRLQGEILQGSLMTNRRPVWNADAKRLTSFVVFFLFLVIVCLLVCLCFFGLIFLSSGVVVAVVNVAAVVSCYCCSSSLLWLLLLLLILSLLMLLMMSLLLWSCC